MSYCENKHPATKWPRFFPIKIWNLKEVNLSKKHVWQFTIKSNEGL